MTPVLKSKERDGSLVVPDPKNSQFPISLIFQMDPQNVEERLMPNEKTRINFQWPK